MTYEREGRRRLKPLERNRHTTFCHWREAFSFLPALLPAGALLHQKHACAPENGGVFAVIPELWKSNVESSGGDVWGRFDLRALHMAKSMLWLRLKA